MRLNKYLASTLLTGLFVTASVLSPAMGQEQSLQPQGSWAITKIDRSTQGGNSYCTLSRKYDDGIVLSLGRNQTEEYSLAIDFQKQVFDKDKSVKINLQPGPGQIRAYDMMPTSDKAVVVRLGWDTGFFDALNQSQQMKVKVADKAYSFAMPEITKGQDDLQDCMEGLQAAAKTAKGDTKTAQTKDVLNAEAGMTSKDFDAGKVDEKAASGNTLAAEKEKLAAQEKSILKGFADSIKSQEPSLNDESAPKSRNFAKFNNDDAAPKTAKTASVKMADADLEQVTTPVPKADVPLPELVKRPEPSAQAAAEKADDISIAKKMAQTAPAAAASDVPATKTAVTSPEKSSEEIQVLQKRLNDLAAENAALKQKTGTVSPEVQKQLDAMQKEKEMLQQKLAVTEQEKAKLAKPEDVVAAQAKAQELSIKNAQLEDSLRQSQVRIGETAINTESKSIRAIAELQVKLDAAQKDNSVLAKQLESMKVQQEDKGLAFVAGDWDLENATKRYNEAEREIRRLGLQLEQERTSCNKEKADIEQMLFDPTLANKKQIERLGQMEEELKAAQAKVADASKLVQDQVNQQLAAKTQSIEAQKAGMAAQISSLQKSLADREAAVTTLQKTAVDNQAFAAEKLKLSQQIAELQKNITAKEAALSAKDAVLASKDATLSAEKTTLQAQLESMKATLAQKETTLIQKDQELAVFKATPKIDPAAADARVAQEVGKVKASADQQFIALQAQTKSLSDSVVVKDKALAEAQAQLKAAQVAAAQPKIDPVMAKELADTKAALQLTQAEAAKPKQDPVVAKQLADTQSALAAAQAEAAKPKFDPVMAKELADTKAALQLAQAEALKPKQDPVVAKQLADTQSALAAAQAEAAKPKFDPAMAKELADTKAALQLAQAEAAKPKQDPVMAKQLADTQSALVAAKAEAAKPKTDPAIMKQLADLQTSMASIKADNTALHDQNIVLRSESDKLHIQLADAQSNGATRADNVASMKLDIENLKRQAATKDTQNATYQNQLATLQQENTQLKTRLTVADSNRGASTDEVSTLTRQIQQLQNQVSDLQADKQRASARGSDRSAIASDYSGITPAAGAVSSAAAPVPAVQAQRIAASTLPTGAAMSGYDKNSIQSLLQKAGLSVNGLSKTSKGFGGADNFAWVDSSNVKGLASVKILGGGDFDAMVNEYIGYQKSQCSGDFASMPSPSNGSAAKRMALYEVACVGADSQSQSASLVFFEDQGRFIAVSNQIGAADMDIAMDSRDKIAGFVRGL